MRAKSSSKRSRRGPVLQHRQYRTDDDTERNPETEPQYFQVSVNVIEARKLVWLNPHSATSYVIVVLDKKKLRTGIRRHMQDPCYREHFTFEQYASIKDIQQNSIWIAVMEPRCCAAPRVLGETNIDLAAIWAQPYHQVIHRWAQLSLPQNAAAGAVGFLKVDISIIFRGDTQLMPVVMNEVTVEENLLLPSGSEQQPANYVITIYGAFGLPNGIYLNADRRYGKPISSFVRVTFCGLSAKTAIQHRTNHPTYCEQLSIVEMFPNMSELIRLDVCSAEGCFNKVLATATLKLGQISHDGENGFLPTFGPSLLHMYGNTTSGSQIGPCDEGPHHRGAMLVSLRAIVPYYQNALKSVTVEPVIPIKPKNLWLLEDFCILCPVLEVSMLDRRLVGKHSGVALTIGELPTDNQGDEEFVAMMSEIKSRKFYYTGSLDVLKNVPVYGYLNFPKAFPVLQLATRLPDIRFRMYRNNMVNRIVADLEQTLSKVEYRLYKCDHQPPSELIDELNRGIDDTAGNLLKYLDIIQYSTCAGSIEEVTQKYSTELDQKQVALQKDEIEKIYQQLVKRAKCTSTMNLIRSVMKTTESNISSKKELKLLLAEIKVLAQSLKSLVFKTSQGWPDIIIWLLNGGSRVAYYKMPAVDIIYSVIPEQNGRHCGRIQTIYLKPLKCSKHCNSVSTSCYCIAGKVELVVWMGLFRQMHSFHSCLPKGYVLKSRCFDMCVKTSTLMLECRLFVYKAKLRSDMNPNHQMCPFARVNALNTVRETDVRQKTCTPVWNQVMRIQRIVYATQDRISVCPPTVLVEICDNDVHSGQTELIGRFEAKPILEDRINYEFAPKLQWYDIQKGAEQTGQVLMSVQLLQIPETLMKSTVYGPVDETYVVPGVREMLTVDSSVKEPLPKNLIPKFSTYKVDIYWWGLRDVGTARRPCVFLEIDDLVIKSDVIVDKKINCNFPNGRMTQTFEAPMDDNYTPPLNIRLYDNSTFGRTLFLGSNVVKNPNKYMVSWLPKSEREASLRSVSIASSDFCQVGQMLYVKKSSTTINNGSVDSINSFPAKNQRSSWMQMFSRRKRTEEECYLLPLFTKDKQIKVMKKYSKSLVSKDWWTRYFSTLKKSAYDSPSINDKIVIYDSELEYQPEFSKFKDWCSTLKLYNGNKTGIPEKDDQLYCGFLKAGIAIYTWPPALNTVAVSYNGVELNYGFFNDFPNNEPTMFLVRVYVVKAMNLVTKAFTGKSDSYVVISCGNKHLGDRKNYVPNNSNPIFGKMYEFRCTLPEDYLLTVALFDYDVRPPDEIIGSTNIDLEDRIYSKHRAHVGLAYEYNLTGPAKWRDNMTPSIILEEICLKNHIPPPIFSNNATVIVNGVEYRDTEGSSKSYTSATERKENICLSLLRKWQTLPICGYHLVPEHVETRTLFNPEKPEMEQGKLQLWVDIFPLDMDAYIPPPVDITPRKLEDFELRIIVWDVQGMKFNEEFEKRSPSEIYVRANPDDCIWRVKKNVVLKLREFKRNNGKSVLFKGCNSESYTKCGISIQRWIGNKEETQYTDVHCSSSSGDGSFNWRMIFHFRYQPAERKIVRKDTGPFTEFEEHVDPILIVQVMDSDAACQDDYLAFLLLNLNEMPRGMKQPHECSLEQSQSEKKINMFSAMMTRGWWPLVNTDRSSGVKAFAGVIDLELTLLLKEKAIMKPVGLGREPPSPLPEPSRKTSSSAVPCFNMSRDTQYLITAITIFILVIMLICAYLNKPLEFIEDY